MHTQYVQLRVFEGVHSIILLHTNTAAHFKPSCTLIITRTLTYSSPQFPRIYYNTYDLRILCRCSVVTRTVRCIVSLYNNSNNDYKWLQCTVHTRGRVARSLRRIELYVENGFASTAAV